MASFCIQDNDVKGLGVMGSGGRKSSYSIIIHTIHDEVQSYGRIKVIQRRELNSTDTTAEKVERGMGA